MPITNLIALDATMRLSVEIRDTAVQHCPLADPDGQIYALLFAPDGSQKYYEFGASTFETTDASGSVQNVTAQSGNMLGRTAVGKYFVETSADKSGEWTYRFVGNFASGVVGIIDGTFSVALDPST